MDGYKILAISGIDGQFDDLKSIEESLNCTMLRYSYNRSMTFKKNSAYLRKYILSFNEKIILFGWSIGADLAAFNIDTDNVMSAILINAFFCRSEILRKRNIYCDEEVCISDAPRTNKIISLIYGILDDKIPYSESIRIKGYYESNNLYCYPVSNAKHNLSSFDTKTIKEIIINNLERSLAYERNVNNCKK